MTPFEQQFEILKASYPEATYQDVAGVFLITIPGIALSEGWSRDTVDVKFAAPAGYPFSQPDCFWTTPGLTLASGANPQNSAATPSPDGTPQHWFSWHVTQWLPNSDTLLTYLRVIENRLKNAV